MRINKFLGLLTVLSLTLTCTNVSAQSRREQRKAQEAAEAAAAEAALKAAAVDNGDPTANADNLLRDTTTTPAPGSGRTTAGLLRTSYGLVCEDSKLIEDAGTTCKTVTRNFAAAGLGCDKLISDLPSDAPLPESAKGARVADACPQTCGLCEECSAGCALWFVGNGLCDQQCNNAACQFDGGDCWAVDCRVSEWSAWGECTVSCGAGGSRTRTRSISIANRNGGRECPALEESEQGCNADKLCPTDCQVSAWSDWSGCSATCGDGGVNTRTRQILVASANNGVVCPALQDTRPCYIQACDTECSVGDWTMWTECSKSCGGGMQYRQRSITQLPVTNALSALSTGGGAGGDAYGMNNNYIPTVDQYGNVIDPSMDAQSIGNATVSNGNGIGQLCPPTWDEQACNTDACPGVCKMSPWTEWTRCSKPCGGGTMNRTRTITDKPADLTEDLCPRTVDTQECNVQKCTADCLVSDWSQWGPCDNTCGVGEQKRTRRITRRPVSGGIDCPELIDTRSCYGSDGCTAEASADGANSGAECQVSNWSQWSKCDATCGAGKQARTRTVSRQPIGTETTCPSLREERDCTTPCDAAATCALGEWGAWGECSVTCGISGTQTRERPVLLQTSDCPTPFDLQQSRPCPADIVPAQCPQDCVLSDWSMWTPCSATCGGGMTRRQRTIVTQAVGTGTACPAPTALVETLECGVAACALDDPNADPNVILQVPDVNCQLSPWGQWGACSVTCGGGTQSSSRTILTFAQGNGQACPTQDQLVMTRPCGQQECPANCEVGAWSAWTECSASCGGGTRTKTRVIVQNPVAGGLACPVLSVEERCNTNQCPQDCEMSPWTQFTACSEVCGQGTMTRTRRVLKQPSTTPAGAPCGATTDSAPCFSQPCDEDCVLGAWGPWGDCSMTCGGGWRTRSREITTWPAGAGAQCSAVLTQTQDCNVDACPRDCKVSAWTEWSDCSVACESGSSEPGTRTRTRSILTTPANGGKACPTLMETQTGCNKGVECPTDCSVGEWTSWTSCSQQCGLGQETRSRQVSTPAGPGGKDCPVLEQARDCVVAACPTDCQVGPFSNWSDCPVTCGGGVRVRERQVTQPPASGGAKCPPLQEQMQCATRSCIERVDCAVSKWSEWSACPVQCGGGVVSRTRTVTAPPVGGGRACPDLKQTKGCNLQRCDGNPCADSSEVQASSGVSCAILASLGCDTNLKKLAQQQGKPYPEDRPPEIRIGDACPASCNRCSECAPGCQLRDIANTVCQPACNNDACQFDGGDCNETPAPSEDEQGSAVTTTPQPAGALGGGSCVDNPMVAEAGFSCTMLRAFSETSGVGCGSTLKTLVPTEMQSKLPSWLPDTARVKDACPVTCDACDDGDLMKMDGQPADQPTSGAAPSAPTAPTPPPSGQMQMQSNSGVSGDGMLSAQSVQRDTSGKPVTVVAGRELVCGDMNDDVKAAAGRDCPAIVAMLPCDFQLANAGVTLPSYVPTGATVSTVCPESCGQCAQTCAAECPKWFVGNGHCDDQCNVASCQFDGGDCPTIPQTPAPPAAPPSAPAAECVDSPLVAQKGYTCQLLLMVSQNLKQCDTTLGDLAAAQGQSGGMGGIPPSTTIADACPKTCNRCPAATPAPTQAPPSNTGGNTGGGSFGQIGGGGGANTPTTQAPYTPPTTTQKDWSGCQDNPLVKNMNMTCSLLMNAAPLGCLSTLAELAEFTGRDLPPSAPGGFLIRDACPRTCGMCQNPTCFDGFRNGDEQWVDCGGSCSRQCQPCAPTALKQLDANLYSLYPIEGSTTLVNGGMYPHGSYRTVTCQPGMVRKPVVSLSSGSTDEKLFCYDGQFSRPRASCNEPSVQTVQGEITVSGDSVELWDSIIVPSVYQALANTFNVPLSTGVSQTGPNDRELRILSVLPLAAQAVAAAAGAAPKCQDDPMVKSFGYECSDILKFGFTCATKLGDLASSVGKTLPGSIPAGATLGQACTKTCNLCPTTRRLQTTPVSGLKITYAIQNVMSPTDTSVLADTFASNMRNALSSRKIDFLAKDGTSVTASQIAPSIVASTVSLGAQSAVNITDTQWETAFSLDDYSRSTSLGDKETWVLSSGALDQSSTLRLPSLGVFPDSDSAVDALSLEKKCEQEPSQGCCGLVSEMNALLRSDCGRMLYSGVVTKERLTQFCEANTNGQRSCRARALGLLQKYRQGTGGQATFLASNSGCGARMLRSLNDMVEGWCNKDQKDGSYCLSQLPAQLTEFRTGINALSDKNADTLDKNICPATSCYRSNVRYYSAVSVFNERFDVSDKDDKVPVRADFSSYLQEMSESLVDAACLKVDGSYCSNDLSVFAKALNPLAIVSNGTATLSQKFDSICRSPCVAPKISRIGAVSLEYAEKRNSPYHRAMGILLQAYGRYACSTDPLAVSQTTGGNRLCGSLIVDGSENVQITRADPIKPSAVTADCQCPDSWLGDGQCDAQCYTAACGWDGNDCLFENMFPSMTQILQSRGIPKPSDGCAPDVANLSQDFTCTDTCKSAYQLGLKSNGCCMAAGVEILKEARAEQISRMLMSNTQQTPTIAQDTTVTEWATPLIEQTCGMSMDRTCAAGADRQGMKLAFRISGVDFATARKSADIQSGIVEETVKVQVARHMSIMMSDITRLVIRDGIGNSLDVEIDIDPSTDVIAAIYSQLSTPGDQTWNLMARAIERNLQAIPSMLRYAPQQMVANTTSIVRVTPGLVPFRLRTLSSPGVSLSSKPPMPYANSQGVQYLSRSAATGQTLQQLPTEPCTTDDLQAVYTPSNYSVSTSPADTSSTGTTRTVTCNANYQPSLENAVSDNGAVSSTDTLTCDNGYWLSKNNLQCRLACPQNPPEYDAWRRAGGSQAVAYQLSLTGNTAQANGRSHGAQMSVMCSDGFYVAAGQGEDIRQTVTCRDGKWDKVTLACYPMCPEFTNPGDGFIVTGDGNRFNATREVKCADGYFNTPLEILHETVTCQADGVWSTRRMNCVVAQAAPAVESAGGFMVFLAKMFGGQGGVAIAVFVVVALIIATGIYGLWRLYFRKAAVKRMEDREKKIENRVKIEPSPAPTDTGSEHNLSNREASHTSFRPPLPTGSPHGILPDRVDFDDLPDSSSPRNVAKHMHMQQQRNPSSLPLSGGGSQRGSHSNVSLGSAAHALLQQQQSGSTLRLGGSVVAPTGSPPSGPVAGSGRVSRAGSVGGDASVEWQRYAAEQQQQAMQQQLETERREREGRHGSRRHSTERHGRHGSKERHHRRHSRERSQHPDLETAAI